MKMKHKKFITFVLTFAVAMAAGPVLAEDGGSNISDKTTRTPSEVRARMSVEFETKRASTTAHRDERREDIEDRKASSTERRIEMQRDLAKRKAEHTAQLFTASVERLGNIITRLESRIAKVDTAGGTTTEAKIFVAEARTHLSLATSSIATFASIDLSSEKARENFEVVRALAKEIKEHFRDAHQSLMNAVRSLKPGRSTATSTSVSDE